MTDLIYVETYKIFFLSSLHPKIITSQWSFWTCRPVMLWFVGGFNYKFKWFKNHAFKHRSIAWKCVWFHRFILAVWYFIRESCCSANSFDVDVRGFKFHIYSNYFSTFHAHLLIPSSNNNNSSQNYSCGFWTIAGKFSLSWPVSMRYSNYNDNCYEMGGDESTIGLSLDVLAFQFWLWN